MYLMFENGTFQERNKSVNVQTIYLLEVNNEISVHIDCAFFEEMTFVVAQLNFCE